MAIMFCLDTRFGQIVRLHVWFVFGPAIFVCAWIASCVAGVTTTALSAILVRRFFVIPRHLSEARR